MTDVFQPGQHPDADQLNAFVELALSPQERDQTLAHLAVCPDCRAVVALSLPPLEELPKPEPEPERTPWFSGWRLAWPVAALAAALLLTIHLQRNTNRSINTNAPVQTAKTSPSPQLAPQDFSTPGPSPAPHLPARQPTTATAVAPILSLPVEARAAAPSMAGLPPSPALSDPSSPNRITGLAMGSGSGTGMNSGTGAMTAPARAATMAQPASDQAVVQLRNSAPSMAAPPVTAGAANSAAFRNSETVAVSAAASTLDLESASTSATVGAENLASVATAQRPLPGHRPILSVASAGAHVVAIDNQHNLFFSDDSGRHWKKIRHEWSGSATRVALATGLPSPATSVNGLMGGLARNTATLSGTESAAPVQGGNFVTGVVTDPTGAIIPGARVSVKDPKTGALHSVTTDRDGRFLLAGLPSGASEVQASAPGFQRLTTTVQVPPTGKVQTSLTLSIGSVSQTVSVESSAPSPVVDAKRKTASSQPNLFEITTDAGERWTSVDGHTWQRQ